MIEPKSEREFDSAYNTYEKWPLELAYRVYVDIIALVNEELGRKEDGKEDCSYGDCDPAHYEHG
jgi:hypothetical protein